MTHVLRQVGWHASRLEGGYRAYRQFVLQQLEHLPLQFRFKVLCGETGTAKSKLLRTLEQEGAQVLDLEALAAHKGSVLGLLPDIKQPGQKLFESSVWSALRCFNQNKPVFVEAESRKIGRLRLPHALFVAMHTQSELVPIQASMSARIQFLMEDYHYFLTAPDFLLKQLDYLQKLHSQTTLKTWKAMVHAGQWEPLVRALLEMHYDPTYRRSMAHTFPGFSQAKPHTLTTLQDEELKGFAQHLLV